MLYTTEHTIEASPYAAVDATESRVEAETAAAAQAAATDLIEFWSRQLPNLNREIEEALAQDMEVIE